MALTAEQLYRIAQIEPSDLGEDVINPTADDATQRTEALKWLNTQFVAGANVRVSGPLRTASGYGSVSDFVTNHPALSALSAAQQAELIQEGEQLFDEAALAYGRSSLKKSLNSNSPDDDTDAADDRIQGNQARDELVKWASMLIETGGVPQVPAEAAGAPRSHSVRTQVRWD